MKTCPRCHAQFDDDINFCKKCGADLNNQPLCPKCGSPISYEDAYCGKCGFKIETIKPVIGKEERAEKKKHDILFARRMFFIISSSVVAALAVLMLVGCFGDIYGITTISREGTYTSSYERAMGVSFYFKDGFNQIKSAFSLKYHEYGAVYTGLFIIQYLLWLTAIGGSIACLVLSLKTLTDWCQNKKDHKENYKFMLFGPLLTLPYVLFISLYYFSNRKTSSGSDYYFSKIGFGWGTMMMLISSVIVIALYLGGRTFLKASRKYEKTLVFDLKSAIVDSIFSLFKYAACLIFIFASAHSVDYFYSQNNYMEKGNSTVMTYFMQVLRSYSAGSIESLPDFALKMIVGFALLFLGFMAVSSFILFSDGRNVGISFLLGAFMLVSLIAGFSFSYSASRDYIIWYYKDSFEAKYYGIQKYLDAVRYSGLGIATYIFTVLVPIFSATKTKIASNPVQQ